MRSGEGKIPGLAALGGDGGFSRDRQSSMSYREHCQRYLPPPSLQLSHAQSATHVLRCHGWRRSAFSCHKSGLVLEVWIDEKEAFS